MQKVQMVAFGSPAVVVPLGQDVLQCTGLCLAVAERITAISLVLPSNSLLPEEGYRVAGQTRCQICLLVFASIEQ